MWDAFNIVPRFYEAVNKALESDQEVTEEEWADIADQFSVDLDEQDAPAPALESTVTLIDVTESDFEPIQTSQSESEINVTFPEPTMNAEPETVQGPDNDVPDVNLDELRYHEVVVDPVEFERRSIPHDELIAIPDNNRMQLLQQNGERVENYFASTLTPEFSRNQEQAIHNYRYSEFLTEKAGQLLQNLSAQLGEHYLSHERTMEIVPTFSDDDPLLDAHRYLDQALRELAYSEEGIQERVQVFKDTLDEARRQLSFARQSSSEVEGYQESIQNLENILNHLQVFEVNSGEMLRETRIQRSLEGLHDDVHFLTRDPRNDHSWLRLQQTSLQNPIQREGLESIDEFQDGMEALTGIDISTRALRTYHEMMQGTSESLKTEIEDAQSALRVFGVADDSAEMQLLDTLKTRIDLVNQGSYPEALALDSRIEDLLSNTDRAFQPMLSRIASVIQTQERYFQIETNEVNTPEPIRTQVEAINLARERANQNPGEVFAVVDDDANYRVISFLPQERERILDEATKGRDNLVFAASSVNGQLREGSFSEVGQLAADEISPAFTGDYPEFYTLTEHHYSHSTPAMDDAIMGNYTRTEAEFMSESELKETPAFQRVIEDLFPSVLGSIRSQYNSAIDLYESWQGNREKMITDTIAAIGRRLNRDAQGLPRQREIESHLEAVFGITKPKTSTLAIEIRGYFDLRTRAGNLDEERIQDLVRDSAIFREAHALVDGRIQDIQSRVEWLDILENPDRLSSLSADEMESLSGSSEFNKHFSHYFGNLTVLINPDMIREQIQSDLVDMQSDFVMESLQDFSGIRSSTFRRKGLALKQDLFTPQARERLISDLESGNPPDFPSEREMVLTYGAAIYGGTSFGDFVKGLLEGLPIISSFVAEAKLDDTQDHYVGELDGIQGLQEQEVQAIFAHITNAIAAGSLATWSMFGADEMVDITSRAVFDFAASSLEGLATGQGIGEILLDTAVGTALDPIGDAVMRRLPGSDHLRLVREDGQLFLSNGTNRVDIEIEAVNTKIDVDGNGIFVDYPEIKYTIGGEEFFVPVKSRDKGARIAADPLSNESRIRKLAGREADVGAMVTLGRLPKTDSPDVSSSADLEPITVEFPTSPSPHLYESTVSSSPHLDADPPTMTPHPSQWTSTTTLDADIQSPSGEIDTTSRSSRRASASSTSGVDMNPDSPDFQPGLAAQVDYENWFEPGQELGYLENGIEKEIRVQAISDNGQVTYSRLSHEVRPPIVEQSGTMSLEEFGVEVEAMIQGILPADRAVFFDGRTATDNLNRQVSYDAITGQVTIEDIRLFEMDSREISSLGSDFPRYNAYQVSQLADRDLIQDITGRDWTVRHAHPDNASFFILSRTEQMSPAEFLHHHGTSPLVVNEPGFGNRMSRLRDSQTYAEAMTQIGYRDWNDALPDVAQDHHFIRRIQDDEIIVSAPQRTYDSYPKMPHSPIIDTLTYDLTIQLPPSADYPDLPRRHSIQVKIPHDLTERIDIDFSEDEILTMVTNAVQEMPLERVTSVDMIRINPRDFHYDGVAEPFTYGLASGRVNHGQISTDQLRTMDIFPANFDRHRLLAREGVREDRILQLQRSLDPDAAIELESLMDPDKVFLEEFRGTLLHEQAHLIADEMIENGDIQLYSARRTVTEPDGTTHRVLEDYNRLEMSPDASWEHAVLGDLDNDRTAFASSYAKESDLGEDFAETVKIYLQSDGGAFDPALRDRFRHRFERLDQIFDVNPHEVFQ